MEDADLVVAPVMAAVRAGAKEALFAAQERGGALVDVSNVLRVDFTIILQKSVR